MKHFNDTQMDIHTYPSSAVQILLGGTELVLQISNLQLFLHQLCVKLKQAAADYYYTCMHYNVTQEPHITTLYQAKLTTIVALSLCIRWN